MEARQNYLFFWNRRKGTSKPWKNRLLRSRISERFLNTVHGKLVDRSAASAGAAGVEAIDKRKTVGERGSGLRERVPSSQNTHSYESREYQNSSNE